MKLSKTIELFDKSKHDRSKFDCGNEELNNYLKKYLAQNIKKNLIKAYVATEQDTGRILGYYTLSSSSIAMQTLDESLLKGLPKYPIPAVLIGRLASDVATRGKGLRIGGKLLIHALKNSLELSERLGILLVIVDAKDGAKSFYQHYGFVPIRSDSDQMLMTIQSIKKL